MFNTKVIRQCIEMIEKLDTRIDNVSKAVITINDRLEKYKECCKCGHLVNKKFMKSEDRISNVDVKTCLPFIYTQEKKIVTNWTCNTCSKKK